MRVEVSMKTTITETKECEGRLVAGGGDEDEGKVEERNRQER